MSFVWPRPQAYRLGSFNRQQRYTWFHNAVYNHSIKEYIGNIVYSSASESTQDPYFAGRVEHLGKIEEDCTILITNLQREDSGNYSLRLWSKDSKWMSPNTLRLIISDSGPDLIIHQENTRVRELEKVTLVCTVNYLCREQEANLTWTGNVKGKKEEVSRVDMEMKNTLTFTASWKNHNDTLQCLLARPSKETELRSIVLNVEYAPRDVQIFPNNSTITIKKGDKLMLECMVHSSNPPVTMYTWYHDRKRGDNTAKRFEVSSPGIYRCEATNNVDAAMSAPVKIVVQLSIKTPQYIKEGEKVFLDCRADASPAPKKYTWYKNSVKTSTTTGRYTISQIKESDTGPYECEAQNELGVKKSNPETLDIKYAPKGTVVVINPSRTAYNEGEQVHFSCITNRSNPAVSSISWMRDGRAIHSLGSPVKLTPKHSGNYTCSAKNAIGPSVSQNPPNKVTVEILNSPKNVIEGQNVSLRCSASESEPKVRSFQWYKDGNRYMGPREINRLDSIKSSDSGKYYCEAEHDLKTVTSEPVEIDVQYAPRDLRVSISPSETVVEKTNVELSCDAKSNPRVKNNDYSWYQNNVSLRKYFKTLTLVEINLEEGGEYYCTADNEIGGGKSETVKIHISYSASTIAKYVAWPSGFFLFLFIIALIVYFSWKKYQRKTSDDRSGSSFFVLKKGKEHGANQSLSESSDVGPGQNPSELSTTDQMDYATIQFPASKVKEPQLPRRNVDSQDPDVIYNTVRKPCGKSELHDYENVKSTNRNQEDGKEEIHYSTITNLTKVCSVRQGEPVVEYAMLRH
ncbi:B-cell receptor CD22-like [Pelodytes ibericus]